jgi:hypothetical protein
MTDPVKNTSTRGSAETKAAPPPAPPKQYIATQNFVTWNGAHILEGSIFTLSDEDAKRALEAGEIEEFIPPPQIDPRTGKPIPVPPVAAAKAPPSTGSGQHKA